MFNFQFNFHIPTPSDLDGAPGPEGRERVDRVGADELVPLLRDLSLSVGCALLPRRPAENAAMSSLLLADR